MRDIEFLAEASKVVRSHHERWDGNGYPDRLAGEEIPLTARVFAVADVFDALTTDRPYRGAMSFAAAAEQMIVNSGSQFDPAVVQAMVPVLAAVEAEGATSDIAGADTVSASPQQLSEAAAQLAVPAVS